MREKKDIKSEREADRGRKREREEHAPTGFVGAGGMRGWWFCGNEGADGVVVRLGEAL